MKWPSNHTLMGIAGFLGMGIGCSGLYLHSKLQKTFKQTVFVRESLNMLRKHEAAKYLLGTPIKDHNIQFHDTENNVYDDEKAISKIPVKGPNGHGWYYIRAEPKGEGGTWVGVRLELDILETDKLEEEKYKDKRLVIFDSDGEDLAALLSFRDSHVTNPRLQVPDPEAAVERVLDPPLDEMVAAHVRGCWARDTGDSLEAYKCQSIVVSSFAKLLGSQRDDNWLLPVMYDVCLDLRLFAVEADKQKREAGKGKPGETLEKASEGIMACFRVCAADARAGEDVTKRWGMLNLVNQLFKIYFKVNKLHLCKPLIRAVESSALKDRFSKSQLVTYKYYVGRKYMFDNNLKEAEEYLRYSFEHCHRDSLDNKKLILIYLIPVKMLLGQMPKQSLLKKYDLQQFTGVMEAVKEGNLYNLNKALEDNERTFIKWGIFLILEKLRIITYRNLFKKVTLLMQSHQISVEAFTTALKMMKVEDVDNDETACILANLIYQGRIKGYISFQHNKLVVSKQNAFPPLSATS